MLLKRLYEYSFRIEDLSPPMYDKLRIGLVIDLDMTGRLTGSIPLSGEGEGKAAARGKFKDCPALPKKRTVAVVPMLLADNAQYVLGLAAEGKGAERTAQCHAAFIALVQRCAGETINTAVQAVANFLQSLDLSQFKLPEGFDPTANITFRISGGWVVDLPEVQRWWINHSLEAGSTIEGQCMVTGVRGPVIERMPQPIKGIPGGQTSGLSLIAMNSEAFESYGRSASYNAPVSYEAAERFGKALNELLRNDSTHLRIGPLAYVFWTREPVDDSFSPQQLREPDPQYVEALLKSPWKGREFTALNANDFYAAALSASGARAVVRDWIETTVPRARDNLRRWFSMMQLKDWDGAQGRWYGVYPLASCLYFDANRDMKASVPNMLFHCALSGGPLPDWLLALAIKRNRAEQGVTRPRAVLIKMLLLSQITDPKEGCMAELELTNHDPAYLCGRLLAVLESVQRLAVPGAQATILDRYFGTASSAPATVFGPLLRGAQAHLAKVRKTRKPAYLAITERIEQITEHLPEFPRTLNLKQQALFSLGYYHQRASDRAHAKSRKELADLTPDTETLSTTEE